MTDPQVVDLTPVEAASLIHRTLAHANEALQLANLDTALDGYVRALGLALQLGPAPTEQVLSAALDAARQLACRHDADGLSSLGPALVDLVVQVRVAGVLPPTAIMEAWATVASDLGMLIGQVGLALAISSNHCQAILDNARRHARLLEEATGNLFALTAWLDQLCTGS
jgi:hypothetical protein